MYKLNKANDQYTYPLERKHDIFKKDRKNNQYAYFSGRMVSSSAGERKGVYNWVEVFGGPAQSRRRLRLCVAAAAQLRRLEVGLYTVADTRRVAPPTLARLLGHVRSTVAATVSGHSFSVL